MNTLLIRLSTNQRGITISYTFLKIVRCNVRWMDHLIHIKNPVNLVWKFAILISFIRPTNNMQIILVRIDTGTLNIENMYKHSVMVHVNFFLPLLLLLYKLVDESAKRARGGEHEGCWGARCWCCWTYWSVSLFSSPLSLSLFVFVTGSCCFCVTPKALLFSFLLYSSYINGNVPSIIERTEYIETIGQQHISIN